MLNGSTNGSYPIATHLPQLSLANLGKVNPAVRVPKYDPSKVGIGIVHIGPGHFFASHLAYFVDEMLNQQGGNWGISAISVRAPADQRACEDARELRLKLSAQDNLYTLLERSHGKVTARVIGSVREQISAVEEPGLALTRLTDVQTKVVSLTITPAGYDAHIKDSLDAPKTWVGYVLKALVDRHEKGIPPFTVLSCDNVQNNGEQAKRCVVSLAKQLCPEHVEWLERSLCAPNTMVDRITPGVTAKDVDAAFTQTGLVEAKPIVTEKFCQFVVENRVGVGFPPLHTAGVEMVDDVRPHELLKLWELNGSHRALAYIGFLLELTYVHEAFDRKSKNGAALVGKFVAGLMDEVHEVLPPIPGYDDVQVEEYLGRLVSRFSDPTVQDQIWRIGKDGSIKLGGRILDPMRKQMEKGGSIDHMAFTVAAWIRYISGINMDRTLFDIPDAHAKTVGLPQISRAIEEKFIETGQIDLSQMLGHESVFGPDLAGNSVFVRAVSIALTDIYQDGIGKAMAKRVRSLPACASAPLTHNRGTILVTPAVIKEAAARQLARA